MYVHCDSQRKFQARLYVNHAYPIYLRFEHWWQLPNPRMPNYAFVKHRVAFQPA
ncbi:hypothetical protein BDV32DRAFT_4712 [Aspergillus pseudonomiae]|nr:hypothetical protein BDV32DRAFT_4712 [Aspergillus pseudonomiae]